MHSPEDARKSPNPWSNAASPPAQTPPTRSTSAALVKRQVRLGELENVSRSEGEEIGLRLFVGQRSATVASSDLSDEALAALVERCLAMAQGSARGPFCRARAPGVSAARRAAVARRGDGREPDPEELRARALEAEQRRWPFAGVTNSSGGGASASATTIALATSGGFSGAYRYRPATAARRA